MAAVGDEKTFGERTENLDADHTYVSLVSDGGNSITGGSIGDIIRFRGMNTYVRPNAPYYYKNPAEQVTKGWVNAYYLLTSDGMRMGERFGLNQEDDGAGATMRGR